MESLPTGTPDTLTFLAPVQQAGNAMTAQVTNLEARLAAPGSLGRAWPALLAVMAWLLAWRQDRPS